MWPIRSSPSQFPAVLMLLPTRPVAERLARLRAAAALVAACLLVGGCAASSATRHGRDAERLQDYDLRRRRVHQGVEAEAGRRRRPSRPRSREAAGVRGALSARPPPRRHRQARRVAGGIRARRRTEPDERRGRPGAPVDPVAVAHQDRGRRAKGRPGCKRWSSGRGTFPRRASTSRRTSGCRRR